MKKSPRKASNDPSTAVVKIRIKDIRVVGEHRPVIKNRMRVIADSMAKIGLKTPITVRASKKGGFVLVTGLHRFEAAKSLGWGDIDCFIMRGDRNERRKWTIAENLHRAGLTALERAELLKEWEELVKEPAKGGQVGHPGGHQPKDKGISETARQLGITRQEVRRSRELAALSAKAKKTAKATGVADNQSVLIRAAKESTPEAQTKKVRELSKASGGKKHTLSKDEANQLKALNHAIDCSPKFKKAWKDATEVVRKKFVKTISVAPPSLDEDGDYWED